MFTAVIVALGVIVYLNIGNWLGKTIFSMVQDDTPSEGLSFWKKVGRFLFFPLRFNNWNGRLGDMRGYPLVISNWISSHYSQLDPEGERGFVGLYTFLWPIFRLIPTVGALIMGLTSAMLMIGQFSVKIPSFIKSSVFNKIKTKKAPLLGDELYTLRNGEIANRRNQIAQLLEKTERQLEEIKKNIIEWESFIKVAEQGGKDTKRFRELVANLFAKRMGKEKRFSELGHALQDIDAKMKELDEMLATIERYKETVRILNAMDDEATSVRQELEATLSAAFATAELCRKIYDAEQKNMAKLDVPIETMAEQIVEGENRADTIRGEAVAKVMA